MDTNTGRESNTPPTHAGSCHCGAVRFQVQLDLRDGGTRCNCSICTKQGITAALVKPAAFTLLAGADSLLTYQWGSNIGTRHFCKVCGVFLYSSGHLPEIGGDFVSFSLNCLDEVDVDLLPVIHWDGRHDNWAAGPRPTPWPRFRATAKAA
jgi:hypothetical protein